jgi:hypothetical protein
MYQSQWPKWNSSTKSINSFILAASFISLSILVDGNDKKTEEFYEMSIGFGSLAFASASLAMAVGSAAERVCLDVWENLEEIREEKWLNKRKFKG